MSLDDAGREKPRHDRRDAPTSSDASSRVLLGVIWGFLVSVLVVLGLAWQVAGAVEWGAVESILFVAWLASTLVGAVLLDRRYS